MALDIDAGIKERFATVKSFGKLIPLTISVNANARVDDIKTVAQYKSTIK